MNPFVKLLAHAVRLWAGLVTFAVFCTLAGITNASVWIIPCATVTAFFVVAALLAGRYTRKEDGR